jgi:hypothetical protein
MKISKPILLLILWVGLGLVAKAGPVNFTAQSYAVFGGNSFGASPFTFTNTTTSGLFAASTGTLVFFESGITAINVALGPGQSSNVSLGNIYASTAVNVDLTGTPIFLKIRILYPSDISPNPGFISGTMSGVFNTTSSGSYITWGNTSLTFNSPSIGSFLLTIEKTTPFFPSIGGNGVASPIRGVLTAIPEPGSIFLLGSGLVGIAGIIRRRRLTRQV